MRTVFVVLVYKRPEKAATYPNKQFRNNPLFSLPICQEEINKVILVWVYELENKLLSAKIRQKFLSKLFQVLIEFISKAFSNALRKEQWEAPSPFAEQHTHVFYQKNVN